MNLLFPSPLLCSSLAFSFTHRTQNNLLCIIRAHEVQELGFHKHFDPSLISERLHLSSTTSTTNKSKYNTRRITSAIISQENQFRPNSLAQPKSPIVQPSATHRPFAGGSGDGAVTSCIAEHEEWESASRSFSPPSETYECEVDMPSGALPLLLLISCSHGDGVV
jgi:hypothetical protein